MNNKVKRIAFLVVFILLVGGVSTLKVQAAGITLNTRGGIIKIGESFKLKLKNAKGKPTWSTTDKKVATVSKKGNVTGIGEGTCQIIAQYNGKKYYCDVTVWNEDDEKAIKDGKATLYVSKKWKKTKKTETENYSSYEYSDKNNENIKYLISRTKTKDGLFKTLYDDHDQFIALCEYLVTEGGASNYYTPYSWNEDVPYIREESLEVKDLLAWQATTTGDIGVIIAIRIVGDNDCFAYIALNKKGTIDENKIVQFIDMINRTTVE